MSLFTLYVVPPGWRLGMPLPFTKAAHDVWRERLEAGTRIVLYDPAREAVVAEGEVHGIFIQPREWPNTSLDELPPSIANADYALPVRLLYQREAEALIPLGDVRRALEDEQFPQAAGELRELNNDTYQLLTQDWP